MSDFNALELRLPVFEGEVPSSATLTLKGEVSAPVPYLMLGGEVFVILRGKIVEVDFKEKKGAMVRAQVAAIEEGFVVGPLTGSTWVEAAKAQLRAASGEVTLFDAVAEPEEEVDGVPVEA